jgi:hypothetical protein
MVEDGMGGLQSGLFRDGAAKEALHVCLARAQVVAVPLVGGVVVLTVVGHLEP